MNLKMWFYSLSLSLATVLIQIPFEVIDESKEYEVVESHKLILSGKFFSRCLNNTLMFFVILMHMFKKIFVDYEVASFENFTIMRDIFDYGYDMQDNLWKIIYLITGQSGS